MLHVTAPARPDPPGVVGEAVARSVLFTDVVESTHTLDELGETVWLDLLERHARLVTTVVDRHGGEVVNFLGDGFMVIFDDPGRALACALRLQLASTVQGLLGTRVGLDHGLVHPYRAGWWVGRAIHVAARLTEIGGAGQVVVSDSCFGAASATFAVLDGERRVVRLRGLCEPTVVHMIRADDPHG